MDGYLPERERENITKFRIPLDISIESCREREHSRQSVRERVWMPSSLIDHPLYKRERDRSLGSWISLDGSIVFHRMVLITLIHHKEVVLGTMVPKREVMDLMT